jgi:uncharacterized repeat protein (TIGR01451 family)
MKKVFVARAGPVVVLVAMLFALGAPAEATVQPLPGGAVAEEPVVRVLRSDLDGVLLDIAAPPPRFQPFSHDPAYSQVEMEGYGRIVAAGAPQLPAKGIMVGIPPQAEVSVRVLEALDEWLPGSYRIVPVPTSVVQDPALLGVDSPIMGDDLAQRRWEVVEDPSIYGTDALYPAAPAVLAQVGDIRHQRLARLEVYPVQVNPQSGQIVYHRRMLVQLRFEYPAGEPALGAGSIQEPGGFEEVLARTVVNYDSARLWRDVRPVAGSEPPAAGSVAGSLDPGYRIKIRETGLYELSYAALQAKGLPPGVDSTTLQMFSHDQEIAIYVEDADGTFGEGDAILFWGEAVGYPYQKYNSQNVYWLTYGHAAGRRMAPKDGTPNEGTVPASFEETMHDEVNKNYWPIMPGSDDDLERWVWDSRYAPGDLTYSAVLRDVAAGSLTATIRTSFWGGNSLPPNPDHHVQVFVNGDQVGEFFWDGIAEKVAAFTFDQAKLVSDSNTIRFNMPGDTGAIAEKDYLDWYEIEYQRACRADGDHLIYRLAGSPGSYEIHVDGFSGSTVETFDVTEPLSVTLVVSTVVESGGPPYLLKFGETLAGLKSGDAAAGPRRYWSGLPAERLAPEAIELDTPSDLRSTANGADYIMIAHHDFLTGTQPLADSYESTAGWRVQVVDVQDVYDEFSGGLLYPGAIRSFLAYTFAQWAPPAPTYVLLVGDGHLDYNRNYDALTDLRQYIPPYLAPVDPGGTLETATDNRYACLGGEVGSQACWPDMYIGRFPVNNPTELETMVNRSKAYQQSPAPGDWSKKMMFVADDPEVGLDFRFLSDEIADSDVPAPYTADKVYYGLAPYTTPAATTQAIIGGLNDGRLLVSYVGHAADYWWAAEKLFQRDDIASLANGERWPIMLPMTCKEGRFQWSFASWTGLSEALVRASGKGAVASWGATGEGQALGHGYLEKGFLEALFYTGAHRLGEAAMAGKRYLWENSGGSYLDLIETYGILGDPALRINRLDYADIQVQTTVEAPADVGPGDVITFTLTLTNAGPDMAEQVVLTDIVPAVLVDPTVIYTTPNVLAQRPHVTFAWTLADLPPDTGGQIRIRATVDPAAVPPVGFYNEAEITALTLDMYPTNNRVRTGVGLKYVYLPLVLRAYSSP